MELLSANAFSLDRSSSLMVASVEFSKSLQIRSTDMLHRRFQSFPEAFSKNLVSQTTKRYTFFTVKFCQRKISSF